MEELLEGMYCVEYPDWGFKIRNITVKEQARLYDVIQDIKADGNEDELTYIMFQELIECTGSIKFNEMSVDNFNILLNSDFTKEVFEDICFNVGMWISRIIKNGLKSQILKVEQQELELLNMNAQLVINNYYETAGDIERYQITRKKTKKQLERAKEGNFEEIEKVSKTAIKLEEFKMYFKSKKK